MQGLVAADDPDLRQSLSDLSRLASAAMALPDMLTNIAEFAVQAIPGADGAGLTLMEHDRPDTVVANADFVGEIDAIQYDLGEGPSLTAVAEGRTVRSGLLSTAPAWPRFGPRSERLGVHSALSLPLLVGASVIGSLNVYARAADAFDERAEELGELFAVPASISVQNAQTLSQATRLAAQLQTALTSRANHRPGHGDRDEPQRLHCRRGVPQAPPDQPGRQHQTVLSGAVDPRSSGTTSPRPCHFGGAGDPVPPAADLNQASVGWAHSAV